VQPGDVLLVCTDGFWVGLTDAQIGSAFVTLDAPLHDTLAALAVQAHEHAAGTSDNISVAALRLLH
jgi:serine/threonine protein phosphatase PrpC